MFFQKGDNIFIRGMQCEILDIDVERKLYRVRNLSFQKIFIYKEEELYKETSKEASVVYIDDVGGGPVGPGFPRYCSID